MAKEDHLHRGAGRWRLDELESICMRNLLANTEERIYFKDREGRFILVSHKVVESMAPGSSAEELLGKTDFDFFDIESAEEFFDGEKWIMETGKSQVGILEVERWRDGTTTWVSTTKLPLRDSAGEIMGTFGISRDVTREVEAEQQLVHQTLHDSLTGLANRSLFSDHLGQALRTFEREPGRVAVLFLDLDNFKDINDFSGHETGDRVLVEVASRLEQVTRPTDTVARFGGDEFVILCGQFGDDDDLIALCDRIQHVVQEPLESGEQLATSVSIGVTTTEDPHALVNELITEADLAMYRAKQLGKARFHFSEPGMRARATASLNLEMELRGAISRAELFLVYQPLFSLADQSISAVEALVRWQHPERGVLLPAEFLPLAERRGLIQAIGGFVLETACAQLAEWRTLAGRDGLAMALNFSGLQLTDPSLVATVTATLRRFSIPPTQLCLEVTENSLLQASPQTRKSLATLTCAGIRIAVDDFGTGLTTMADLHNLEVHTLKIDRRFVERIGRSARSRQVVVAFTTMAHALGINVVAEGIETEGQLTALDRMSCDDGQGFLLARPQSVEAVTKLLS